MSVIRIVAILIGAAVMAGLGYGLGASWYISMPIGIISYLVVHYAGWAINKRRRLHQAMDRLVEKKRNTAIR